MKGKLIVIEGIDGVGKATQTKLLSERLNKEGYKTATLDFPQYYDNFFGKLIGRFQNNEFGDAPKTNPYLASVLYAADRWEAKGKIEGWIKEGRIVIMDRYVSSNEIHQGGKIADAKTRSEFLKWVEEMEYEVFKIPKPDIIILLNVSYETARQLIVKKTARNYIKNAREDKVEESQVYQENAYRQSLEMVKSYNNWIEINCVSDSRMLPPDVVNDKIWQEAIKEFIV